MIKDFMNPIVEEYLEEGYQPICPKCGTSTINYGIIDEDAPPCFAYCMSCGVSAEGDTLNEVFLKLGAME